MGGAISSNERDLLDALNSIEAGIVLLTPDLRARFANDAFLKIWGLRADFLAGNPDFAWIMRVVATQRKSPLIGAELDAYVTQRVEVVRAGREDPRNIRMDDGSTVRVTCKALPGGGRLLLYADVTDMVRRAEELETMATTDPLSGLLNRREFFRVAESHWQQFVGDGRKLSAMMIDVDEFKSINDKFGHDVGDQVIVTTANVCRALLRQTDSIARFGGEEFAVVMPDTDLRTACMLAEKLREGLSSAAIAENLDDLRITVSIGVSEARHDMTSLRDLISATDQGLYAAKRSGKDRVCTMDIAAFAHDEMITSFASLVKTLDTLLGDGDAHATVRPAQVRLAD
jgi:diguanylate cyclase (GGDEF)-like protein